MSHLEPNDSLLLNELSQIWSESRGEEFLTLDRNKSSSYFRQREQSAKRFQNKSSN